MKHLFLIPLLIVTLLSLTTSCGKDEAEQPSEQSGNQSAPGTDDQNDSSAPIIVTVDANGNADGGHRFINIDDESYYIDDIKYTVSNENLIVTGYNEALSSGETKIISQLNYVGREMRVIGVSDCAFEFCTDLTSVTIPSSVTSIGIGSFSFCTGLTTVTIPSSVTSIGGGAFYCCTNLTSVQITDLAAWCMIAFGDTPFDSAHHLYLKGQEIKDLRIPSSVTSIGNEAFSFCSGLTSVTIPSSVTSIGTDAFSGCTGLTSVTIPSSVTDIGVWAFSHCTGLISISVAEGNSAYDSRNKCNAIIETKSNKLITGCKNTIIPSSVTSIGEYAFLGCTGMTSVTIPSSVTDIGKFAFHFCTSLTTVTIPSSVTSIGEYAFNNCKGLSSVTIPDGITIIEEGTFNDCMGLSSVTIPPSVTSIGDEAFSACKGLTSVTIPSSVTNIGKSAFHGCTGLTDLYCYAGTVPKTGLDTFAGSPIANMTLHVPESAISAYRATAPWSGFGTIVVIQ